MSDLIDRQAAIDAVSYSIELCNKALDSITLVGRDRYAVEVERNSLLKLKDDINLLLSAQPEQRYTEEELRVFKHGISLSLLSKRSSQHWQYDEDTATEIKFLERLYEKVSADMRGAE